MEKVRLNFELTEYTPPAVDAVNYTIGEFDIVLDGDDFELTEYTPPALDEVNFSFGGTVYDAILKTYNGAAWVKGLLKTYNGAFVKKPLKVYLGTVWGTVDIDG